MMTIREAIIVEGRYDKIKLSGIVNAPIIETGGFRVFSDKEKQSLIRQIAAKRGILVLTDSDGAGFVIRNFLRGVVPKEQMKHCYIPQIAGKERRQPQKSKEGLLGVEGVTDEIICDAIRKAVSLGGDSDTLACITGGIAEAFYKEIPKSMADRAAQPFPVIFNKILDAVREETVYGKTCKIVE